MQLLRKDVSTLIIPLVVLILVSEISLITVTVKNNREGVKQRLRNREITLTVLRESYSQKCLLLIPNTERTEANIDKCDQEAKVKVDKLRG